MPFTIDPRLKSFMEPHNLLLAYIFMIFTGIGSDYSFFKSAMIEQGVFLISFSYASICILRQQKPLNESWLWLSLLSCLVLLSLPVSSYANDHLLSIITTSKYRQLIKIFLCILAMHALINRPRASDFVNSLAHTSLLSTLVLSLTVLIRFYVFHEAHPETGRLNLDMRHGNANYVAAYLGALLFFCAAAITRFAPMQQKFQRIVSIAVIAASIICIYASSSRMGILAVFVGAAVSAIFEARRRRDYRPLVWLFVLLAVLISAGAIFGGFSRFEKVIDPSSLGRVQGIKAGLILFSNHPFFGAGFDQTPQHIYQLTSYPVFRGFAAPPVSLHNAWFQMLAEMGLFGFLSMMGLWIWVIAQIRRMSASTLRSILFGGLTVVFLNQQTLPVAYNDVFYGLILLIGLWAVSAQYSFPKTTA